MRRIPRLRRLPLPVSSRTQLPCAAFCPAANPIVPARAPFSTTRTYRDNKPLPRDLADKPDELLREVVKELQDDSISKELAEHGERDEFAEWQPPAALQSNLPLPPEKSEAERADAVADPRYVAATSSEGLETVGGLKGWWDQDGHWQPEHEFESFRSRKRVENPAVLQVVARRAVIETLAVKQLGREDLLTEMWNEGGWAAHGRALEAGIDGSAVNAPEAELRKLVQGLEFRDVSESEEGVSEATQDDKAYFAKSWWAQENPDVDWENAWYEMKDILPTEKKALRQISSWDKSWQSISLADPRVKFAVLKRIFQLSGQKIPDNKLGEISNVRSLLRILCRPAKPKKLADELRSRSELLNLPNVKLYTHRVTPIHKDKMAGRWKVIKKELEKRELPVTGTAGYGKVKEREWLRGGA